MMNTKYENYLTSYLKNLSHSTPQEIDSIKPDLKITAYGKGDFFLKRGEVQKDMGFISEGLVRRYYINEKGNQITTGFAKENEYLTDYPAFIQQRPTKYFLQCIEPSVIIGIPYTIIQLSYEEFTNGQLYGRLMAEQTLTILNDRIEGFLFYTAEERYLKFIREHPELMNRVSLTHLSSFLGIERQSLSRIRKRIAKK
ncbi:Crp/Fnr family transcriptional regulator [Ulvibacterium sp.]|uniref:Crp/Fnr family transcriptional regulator n=1 Tax=Ulvibacterium sp. TaxID=2665914 RepID=UPI00260F591C|nr:Crp/Fnr family transcriptional regulator [Ulvibacterium sp.]